MVNGIRRRSRTFRVRFSIQFSNSDARRVGKGAEHRAHALRRPCFSPRGLRGACHRAGHFGPGPLAQPTLRKDESKEAERRQTQCFMTRTQAACGAHQRKSGLRRPPLAGALACRRSTTALAKGSISSPRLSPGQASWEAASTGRASRRRRRTHFQRCTSHAGRNAGRHDARTARERIATPPAGTDLAPTPGYASRTRPFGRGFDSLVCNRNGDRCQGSCRHNGDKYN